MYIGGEDIENPLMNMVLKKNFKQHESKNEPFHVSLFRNGLKIF
jgi:hypothetical protein